jgi:hypothetical protein
MQKAGIRNSKIQNTAPMKKMTAGLLSHAAI